MIVAIHQPDYIPYLGFFYKIAKCDCFVFLDDAQYSNTGFSNWNKIKTPQGELHLKIPVQQTLGDAIKEVTTKDFLGWKQKHLKILQMNYRKAEYFDQIYTEMEQLLIPDYKNIADMNIAIIQHFCNQFGFTKRFERSSDLDLETRKEERVIDICSILGGNIYLSGNGAKVYQVEEHFNQRNIELRYTDYHAITYDQLWGAFIPNLSIVDYLFYYGYDWQKIEAQIMRKK